MKSLQSVTHIRAILAILGASILALLTTLSWAQEQEEAESQVEEIIVTGSNIRGTPVDGASAVQIVSRNDLENEGLPTLRETIRRLGIANGNIGETNQFQPGFGQGAEGVTTANIRGLGHPRTLVLINGKRTPFSANGFADYVNLNQIPTIALQRAEILKEGAAATYGSDAVSGVANFITRSDFEGVEISANLSMVTGSSGDTQLGAIWGNNYGSGMIVVSYGLQTRGELSTRERPNLFNPVSSESMQPVGWSSIGNPGTWIPATVSTGTMLQVTTDFNALFGGGQHIPDPACGEDAIFQNSQATMSTSAFGMNFFDPFCRFSYTPFDNLIEEEEHSQIYVEWQHDFSPTSSLRIDFLSHDTSVPEWKTSPSYPPQSLFGGVQYVFADHPGLENISMQTATSTDTDIMGIMWGSNGGIFYGRTYGASGPANTGVREHSTTRINADFDFEAAGFDMHIGLITGSSSNYLQGSDASIHRTGLAFRGLGGPNCPVTVNAAGHAVTTAVVGTGATAVALGTVLYEDLGALVAHNAIEEGLTDTNGDPNLFFGDATQLINFRAAVTADDDLDCLYYTPFSNAVAGTSYANAVAEANMGVNSLLDDNNTLRRWLLQDLISERETDLFILDYSVQGDLANLGGGQAKWIAGIQLRTNDFSLTANDASNLNINPCPNPRQPRYTPPPVDEMGDVLDRVDDENTELFDESVEGCRAATGQFSFLAGATPFSASQDITSLFGEVALPFSDTFNLQVALRYEDYGSVNSIDPKLSFRWKPSDAFTLRGSFGTTFRGPTPAQAQDGLRVTSLAFVGLTSAFKAVDIIGNGSLEPESATTTNFGVVWQPSSNLQLTLDYWSIDLTNPIIPENHNQLTGAAYDNVDLMDIPEIEAVDADNDNTADNQAAITAREMERTERTDTFNTARESRRAALTGQIICQGGVDCLADMDEDESNGRQVTPGPNIIRIDTPWVNGADTTVSGLDFSFKYDKELDTGSYRIGFQLNQLLAYDVGAYSKGGATIAASFDALGFLNYLNPAPSLPDTRWRVNVGYGLGQHDFSVYLNTIGAYEDNHATSTIPSIDAWTTIDFHYNWRTTETSALTLSLINLADELPPPTATDLGYDQGTHSAYGLIAKVGYRYQF